jgi:hypothetical protein
MLIALRERLKLDIVMSSIFNIFDLGNLRVNDFFVLTKKSRYIPRTVSDDTYLLIL